MLTTQGLRDYVLITAKQLSALLTADADVVVLAVHSPDSKAPFPDAPAIPGAMTSDLSLDFADPTDPVHGSRPLPDLERFQSRARLWGIQDASTVVVYDHDGGLQAARAWWVLKWAGVKKVRLLDGGFQAWTAEGLATGPAARERGSGGVTLVGGQLPVLDADQAADMARTGVLLDTRMAANYEGGPSLPGEAPRGHIPGAINIPAAENLRENGAFKDVEALKALYESKGVQAGRPVGVYCGAGVSAAHGVAALAILGVRAAMYPGSWSAWISDPDRPVATGAAPGPPQTLGPVAKSPHHREG